MDPHLHGEFHCFSNLVCTAAPSVTSLMTNNTCTETNHLTARLPGVTDKLVLVVQPVVCTEAVLHGVGCYPPLWWLSDFVEVVGSTLSQSAMSSISSLCLTATLKFKFCGFNPDLINHFLKLAAVFKIQNPW